MDGNFKHLSKEPRTLNVEQTNWLGSGSRWAWHFSGSDDPELVSKRPMNGSNWCRTQVKLTFSNQFPGGQPGTRKGVMTDQWIFSVNYSGVRLYLIINCDFKMQNEKFKSYQCTRSWSDSTRRCVNIQWVHRPLVGTLLRMTRWLLPCTRWRQLWRQHSVWVTVDCKKWLRINSDNYKLEKLTLFV